jgi:hypothetical protein
MPLVKLDLENAIKAALKKHNDLILNTPTMKKSSADDQLAADLAKAINDFILSGDVIVNPGIPTAGGSTNQTTIAPGKGKVK